MEQVNKRSVKKILTSFQSLKEYCEKENFLGWDPYDGLNSKVFNALPLLKKIPMCRLLVIQGFKRLPINLRKIARVPKQYNAKGLGLLLSGYCNLYHAVSSNGDLDEYFGSQEEISKIIEELGDLLISLQSKGNYHGACWGYGFDWQSKAFFLPAHTPTVVATSFVVEALLRAYEITGKKDYLQVATSSADFILKDLNRIQKGNGFMFSYSPLDNRAVYNATLLGTKTLSLIYYYSHDEQLKDVIKDTVYPILTVQNKDGSFPHSDQVGNSWRDNFHTGFKLESLMMYEKVFNDSLVSEALSKGYNHWISHFFNRKDGIAKYYENDTPDAIIDLHCLAQSIPTLYALRKLNSEEDLVEKMIIWASDNMQAPDGAFYFQKKKNKLNKIKYMRWPNSWMFYGISFYIRHLAEK